MKLINTDGMAFIGPGSEWFWTALTGIVLAVTFLAIYRQLSMARSFGAREVIDSFDREWESERMLRHRLAILVALRDGVDRAHLAEGSALALASFWDRIAYLARSGHIDRRVIYHGYSSMCLVWWSLLAPPIRRWRDERRDPRVHEDLEWLAGFVAEMDRQTAAPTFDEASITAVVEGWITGLQDQLRVEQALHTVTVASPAAPTLGQRPAPVAAQR